jgi:hypothetical protein
MVLSSSSGIEGKTLVLNPVYRDILNMLILLVVG